MEFLIKVNHKCQWGKSNNYAGCLSTVQNETQDEKSPIISSGMVNGCGRGLPVDERHKNANWLPTQRTVVYGMFHKNSLNV